MAKILVIAEHRNNELREITLQMLNKASELCRANGHELYAAILGNNIEGLISGLKEWADKVIVYNDPRLKDFNPDNYRDVLTALINEQKPIVTFLGHTPWSMDLAPGLSVKTGFPLATDCVDITMDSGRPKVVRQVYSGKIFSRMAFRDASGYLITVRAGAFPAAKAFDYQAEIIQGAMPDLVTQGRREFMGYRDTCKGEVDITQAELLVSIGRGIGEQDNIPQVQELAGIMGGTLSCSRPVVDKKWLPKYHQVGTSGKSVKPKVYLALGISGAFQHVAGISGAGTVIAVNKDKKAPIFRVAHYGAVADLLNVAAALKEKVSVK
ncbi:MAG: electron transfer flavoprotein subunit alpha/FixB family protein [Deltaproteobacteria bacterium]|nr:electron transfer flavoprotein subunit alpha/FixB family protein [Deltaproteobacteria bacterium]